MGIYKDLVVRISGNTFMQRFLAMQVRVMKEAMGIGSSGDFYSDGEFAAFDLVKKNCLPPYCVFDVGANKGQFLGYALVRLRCTEYRIHCFEPGREPFNMLAEMASTNDRVTLNNLGLSSESREAILHYNEKGAEGASLTKRNLDHYGIHFDHSESVQLTTLDEYCLANNVGHINLLKLDIEGHELDALTGARSMIVGSNIDYILFEFGGCNIDTRRFFRDYWHFFATTPMDLFRVTPTGYLSKISKYHEEHEQFLYSNFIAIRRKA